MTTIKDIARSLGVSPSTVSRALSGSDQVSEMTCKKVRQLAKTMNYTPNLWARNLANAQSDTIGCVILQYANPFYIPLIEAVEDVAEEAGYSIIINQSHRNINSEKKIIDRMVMMRVQGIIITPTLEDLSHLKSLKLSGLPIIFVGRSSNDFEFVNIDNIMGGRLTGEHLIEKGYHQIGIVYSGETFNEPEQARILGLKAFLQEKDIAIPNNHMICVGNNNPDGGQRAAKNWLNQTHPPRAVFCTNDRLAIGFIRGIKKSGKRVPEDVAVIGFDDIPFQDYMEVPLTTIAYPIYQMGEIAARRLIDIISAENLSDEPFHHLLAPELIVRKSI